MEGLVFALFVIGLAVAMKVAVVIVHNGRSRQFAVHMREFAQRVDGDVTTDPARARPRTASPNPHPLLARLGQVTATTFFCAVDFVQSGWPVRVTAARTRKVSGGGDRVVSIARRYSHVIEIDTPPSPRLEIRSMADRDDLAETAEDAYYTPPEDEAIPYRVDIPRDYSIEAFTDTPRFGKAALGKAALTWLVEGRDILDAVGVIVIDSGLLHATVNGPPDPDSLPGMVDFLTGLLDRIPRRAWELRGARRRDG